MAVSTAPSVVIEGAEAARGQMGLLSSGWEAPEPPWTPVAKAEMSHFPRNFVSPGTSFFPGDFARPRGNFPRPGEILLAAGEVSAPRPTKNLFFAPAELAHLGPIRGDRGHRGLQRGQVYKDGQAQWKKLWAILSEISVILAKPVGFVQ